jgi:hypothetical protein
MSANNRLNCINTRYQRMNGYGDEWEIPIILFQLVPLTGN